MTTAAKMTTKLMVMLQDPTGRKRAQARQRMLMMAGAAIAASMLAAMLGMLGRRRRQRMLDASAEAADARTAGTMTAEGHYRSRHGAGAATGAGSAVRPFPMGKDDEDLDEPLDRLAASAQRLQAAGSDEPGFRAHLGFGVGGSIPTAGGDALGGTVRGGEEVGFADEIVTGAGEAISNSTTPAPHGHGADGLY